MVCLEEECPDGPSTWAQTCPPVLSHHLREQKEIINWLLREKCRHFRREAEISWRKWHFIKTYWCSQSCFLLLLSSSSFYFQICMIFSALKGHLTLPCPWLAILTLLALNAATPRLDKSPPTRPAVKCSISKPLRKTTAPGRLRLNIIQMDWSIHY